MEERETAAAAGDEEQSEKEGCESDISAATADGEHTANATENKETEERLPQKVPLPKELSNQLSALVDWIVAESRQL